jgi:hypothetical protein
MEHVLRQCLIALRVAERLGLDLLEVRHRRAVHQRHQEARRELERVMERQHAHDAIALAERVVQGADEGRLDLADLSRRARRLLEATAQPSGEGEKLF